MRTIKHVVCAVSGGVDSAVATYLLKKKGFHVTGVFMRNWDVANELGECRADADQEDARYACRHLNVPFQEVNFVKEYWTEVFSDLIEGYKEGLTPNPDILCNKFIKFGHFFQHATQVLGADALATGHYARSSAGQYLERTAQCPEGVKLLKSVDQLKDQTLFLSQISQHALRRTMFPVGGLYKDDVKNIAKAAGLDRIYKKKESMGICFIGTRYFQDFIEEYIEPQPGNFIDIDTGEVMGQHKGIHCWTLGQRAQIPGRRTAYFIAQLDKNTQDIIVAEGTDHPALYYSSIYTDAPHWIHSPPADLVTSGQCSCDFRFQHVFPVTPCRVRRQDDGGLRVDIAVPLRALTPGQYAVLYQGDECLGSAKILRNGQSVQALQRQQTPSTAASATDIT